MFNYGLIFFADNWGTTKGGINSVNFDLCNAIGDISARYNIKVICVCTNLISKEVNEAAIKHNVNILSIEQTDFENGFFEILKDNVKDCKSLYAVGHDVLTARQSKLFKKMYGGRTVIFHHMDYEAYYGAKATGVEVIKKIQIQKNAFADADYIVAVGPKLLKSIGDKIVDWNLTAKYGAIIPGLADIAPSKGSRERFRALVTGRIEANNDTIKQYGVPLEAYCKLQSTQLLADGSSITLLGLEESEAEKIEKNIINRANSLANGHVNVLALPYTTDRDELHETIRNSSVLIMPSLSEGFGLVGLEAISAGVPLILSKKSGLFEFLYELGVSGWIEGIDIKGSISDKPNNVDVQAVYDALINIISHYTEKKQHALQLRQKLYDNNITWEYAAKNFLELIDISVENKATAICNLLSEKVQKAVPVYAVANKYFESIIGGVNDEFKIDKEVIENQIFDSIDQFYDAIIHVIFEECTELRRYRSIEKITKIFKSNIKNFFADIISCICKNYSYSSASDLMNELLNRSLISTEKKYANEVGVGATLSSQIVEIARNEQILSVLSDNNYDNLNDYHMAVANDNEHLDFDGLSIIISSDTPVRIPLKRVFADINLDYKRDASNNNLRRRSSFENSYIKNFIDDKRTIVLGDPGTGKSTLMKRVLLDLCDDAKRKKINNHRMCIYVRISEFSNWLSDGNESKTLDDYIFEKCIKVYQSLDHLSVFNTYKKLKDFGGLVVLIDGYDEVKSINSRQQVRQIIGQFIDETPESVFVVTSRIVGYDNSFDNLKFKQCETAPLSFDAINKYIENWYKVISELFLNDRDDDYLANKIEKLKTNLNMDEGIRILARNPLLLSILTILNYHGINIPNNKAKLYETISNTLLETWIMRKGFADDRYTVEYLSEFFSNVAYEIIVNNYDTMLITETKLRQMYSQFLSERESFTSITKSVDKEIDTFISYISKSLGVLLNKGTGFNNEILYGFLMHRQFTEYFAAIKLEGLINAKIVKLKNIIFDSKWTEIITLMGSFMNSQKFGGKLRINRVIRDILKIQSKPINCLEYNTQLVLKLMANNVYLESDVLKTIESRIYSSYQENNPYKILQMCNEFILMFGSIYHSFIYNILYNSLIAEDYSVFSSACIVVNEMYKYPNICQEALAMLNKENMLVKALERLVLTEKDSAGFFIYDGGYFQTFFENTFILTLNNLEPEKIKNEKNLEKIKRLIQIYAAEDRAYNNEFYWDYDEKLEYLVNKAKTIKNPEFAKQYLIVSVLNNIGYDLASFEDMESIQKLIKIAPECTGLLESSKNAFKNPLPYDRYAIRWISGNFQINYYKEDENNHYVIFKLEDDKLVRHDIIMSNTFSSTDLEEKLKEKRIEINNAACHLLEVTMADMLPSHEVKELFNYAYNKKYILYRNGWAKILFEQNNDIDDFLYKFYSELIALEIFKELKQSSKHSKLRSILYKLFSGTPSRLSLVDNKWLVNEYEMSQNNYKKRNILYDLINRANNPFRNLHQSVITPSNV